MDDEQYGGAPKLPIDNGDKSKEMIVVQDEILLKLQKSDSLQGLNKLSKKLFARYINELEKLAEPLIIDYHVVIFNEAKQKRYSIIEGKKPTFGSKDLTYGVVGSLLTPYYRSDYSAIFVQFGAGNIVNPVVYFEKSEERIEIKDIKDLSTVLDNGSVIWRESQKKINDFAIAATLLEDNGKGIGAISIDFGTKSTDYPNFAFQKKDVRNIFNLLYTMKNVFEMFKQGIICELLDQTITIVMEEPKHDK